MELKSTEWIFFDVGYTLVNEDLAHQKRIEHVISQQEQAGIPLTFDAIHRRMVLASQRYSSSPFKQALADMGIEAKVRYPKEYEQPYPAATSVLHKLKTRYKLGIIANQSSGTADRLKQYGIWNYMDVCISSTEEGIFKPDIAIYQLALEQAGCAAANAVMIGDRLDNDVYPAKRAGMRTVWIRQGYGGMQQPKNEDYAADYTVNSLEELIFLFKL